jgi:outer membrane biosynthesis protein TonB
MPTPRESEKAMRSRSAVLVSAALVLVLGGALFAVALVIQPRDRGERVAAPNRTESKPDAKAEAKPESAPESRPEPPAPSTPSVAGPPPPPTAPPTPRPMPTPVMVTPKVAAAPVGSVQVVPSTESAAPPVQTVAPPNLDILAGVSSPYRLVARTTEATWIRVRSDDGRNTEESIPAGEVREYVSNRPFILTVGNAAGVSFELNGRPVPPLGARGSVIPRLVLPPEAR